MRTLAAVGVGLSMLACARPGPAGLDSGASSEESSSTTTATSTSDTSTETSDTSTTQTFDGPAPPCFANFSIEPELVPTQLMLVVDTSTSMFETWDHDGDPNTPEITRWASARALLEQLLPALPEYVEFGLVRYPDAAACPNAMCSDADVCLAPTDPQVSFDFLNAAAILDALPPSDAMLLGGSPAREAFASARAQLLDAPELPREILLLTDGANNCSAGASLPDAYTLYDDALPGLVQQARELDLIRTIVVGVGVGDVELVSGEDTPQINAFAALNELALVGGSPWDLAMHPQKFFTADQLAALLDALQPLDFDFECSIDLTQTEVGAPGPIPTVVLSMEGMELPYTEDCASEPGGWRWLDSGVVLELCSETCGRLNHEGTPLEIFYGCEAP